MKDPRIETLAHNLIHYSIELKKGENILLQYTGRDAEPLIQALIREIYVAGGRPYIKFNEERVLRELLKKADTTQLDLMASADLHLMKQMDCYIGIGARDNSAEFADLDPKMMNLYMEHYQKPVHSKERVPNTRWAVLRYPNNAMALLSGTSLESFEDFYFQVCNMDYGKMSTAMDPLIKLMEQTDKVRITGSGTDLSFSIKNIPAVKCAGKINIPDGEVFTAPVKDSVEGYLTYNTPAEYQGVTYENIRFEFEKGKIVKAIANDTERINTVLDTDEGARFIGEFALGVNPYILKAMKNTLFDEKIMGSFHFTPGQCYDEAFNGNHSAIHWDLVSIQTPDYGGGTISFDDVLIRKDGRFVLPELDGLNPENLK